jgi:hypothetical protein
MASRVDVQGWKERNIWKRGNSKTYWSFQSALHKASKPNLKKNRLRHTLGTFDKCMAGILL